MRKIKLSAFIRGKTLRDFVIELLDKGCGQDGVTTVSMKGGSLGSGESLRAPSMPAKWDNVGSRKAKNPASVDESIGLSNREILEQESAPKQVIPAWAFDLPEGSEEQKFLVAYLRKRGGAYPSSEQVFRLRFERGEI